MMIVDDFPGFDPQTAASQGNAVLGIRDSGKSYTAIGIGERYYDAGIPWVALDPSGRWRHIRVPGKGKGYPVVVAGGLGGDLPLTVEGTPELVRAAMHSGVSLVIDLYDINIGKADWRRIVADVVRVLFYENAPHGLRHIFIEEAAEFAPQRPQPDQGKVYAEIERLARMGGNARLGYTLINQRAEEVSKAVLELCDNLFLHRQKGKNSLLSLGKWLDVGDTKIGKEIVASLPTLPQGECWAWMAGTERPVRVKVPMKNSAEPDRRAMRGEVAPQSRQAVDVGAFVEQMRAALKSTSEEGGRKIAKSAESSASVTSHHAHAQGRAEGYADGWRDAMKKAGDGAFDARGMIAKALECLRLADRDLNGVNLTAQDESQSTEFPESSSQVNALPKASVTPKPPTQRKPSAGNGSLPAGADGLLAVVVNHWPAKLTWTQVAALAGRKPRGGHFNNSRKGLIDAHLVVDEGGAVIPTQMGFDRAGGKPARPPNLTHAFLEALPNPADKMLRALINRKPETISFQELGDALSMLPRGGHWNNGLAMLTRCNLIEKNGDQIRLRKETLR